MRISPPSATAERSALEQCEARKAQLESQIATLHREHEILSTHSRPLLEQRERIRAEITTLEKDHRNRRMWTSWTGVLNAEAQKRKERLESEIKTIDTALRALQQNTSQPDRPMPSGFSNNTVFTSFWHELKRAEHKLNRLLHSTIPLQRKSLNDAVLREEREAYKQAKVEARRKKREKERALLAKLKGKSRDRAGVIKKVLPRTESCPYCGGLLGSQPHADHIYPQSKGGLSVEANMVYVCVTCNNNKGDLTLAAFIQHFGLNRSLVEERLRALGKEF